MIISGLSAVLLAIPLSLSHTFMASLLEKSGLAQCFQEHTLGGPRIMVWSWQHNDDLSYLDTARVGVAYLVGRFVVDGERLAFDRSFSQIKLPAGVYREAAVRLEIKALDQSKLDSVADNLSKMIVSTALGSPHAIAALQVDFDARVSDRKFYALLLRKLRARLPAGVGLSMTALASWCLGDNWLSGSHLPIDEVVPMLFSLGLGQHQVTQWLAQSSTLSPNLFGGRLAPGLSLNEPRFFELLGSRLAKYKRVYIFSSHGWKRNTFLKATSLLDGGAGIKGGIGHD